MTSNLRKPVSAIGTPYAKMQEVERGLSEPAFLGVPLGPTLNDVMLAHLDGRFPKAGWKSWTVDRFREWRFRLWPFGKRGPRLVLPTGRVLVTWSNAKYHNSQLMRPIVDQLGPENCLIIAGNASVAAALPKNLTTVAWQEAMTCDRRKWRRELMPLWPDFARRLREACHKLRLPIAVSSEFRLGLLLASQYVMGCENFLAETRPSAVLVDYDRNRLWSVLVLVARRMGIPTYTLVHGVLSDDAIGFAPVLADRVFCWGAIDRQKFLDAGTDPTRLLVAGCPRLHRGLTAERIAARTKAALPADKPLVLLATAPYTAPERKKLAGTFCEAMEQLPAVTGAVRPHPMEDPATYAPLIARYPSIRFLANATLSVDEAIAAADAVVVHCSGFGSDALVNGRPVVVLDILKEPLGHGADLIAYGGCPAARNAEELAGAIRSVLFDEQTRQRAAKKSDEYARLFCAAYGDEAARNIARTILAKQSA